MRGHDPLSPGLAWKPELTASHAYRLHTKKLKRDLRRAIAAGHEHEADTIGCVLADPKLVAFGMASEHASAKGGNPFDPIPGDMAAATNCSTTTSAAARRPRTRARGAGRRRAAASRSSARSGDSGDDGPGEPEPAQNSHTGDQGRIDALDLAANGTCGGAR